MQVTQSVETPDQVRDRHAAYYRALLAELEDRPIHGVGCGPKSRQK